MGCNNLLYLSTYIVVFLIRTGSAFHLFSAKLAYLAMRYQLTDFTFNFLWLYLGTDSSRLRLEKNHGPVSLQKKKISSD